MCCGARTSRIAEKSAACLEDIGEVTCAVRGDRVFVPEQTVLVVGNTLDLVLDRLDMSNRMAGNKVGRTADSESAASERLDAVDLTTDQAASPTRDGHMEHTTNATVPAVPSDQLQAGLAKPSRLPNWAKPTIRIWPGQGKPTDNNTSDPYGPPQTNRILDWLAGLLERTEDAVGYLRAQLGRMPIKADPVSMAGSEEGERLRCALDEQLKAGATQSDLIKTAITNRARLCTALGGLFALPGTVPGIGTAAQFVLGMAATWPEMDLIRYQAWCLQVELLHLHGMAYSEADADLLSEGFLNYEWINKGGEVFAQRLLVRLRQSATVATKFLDSFLVKIGASAALRESAGRILSKTLPLGIGVAIGATVNYLKLHLFARRQLHRMQVTAD